ncbi:MAG: hypothetical protein LBN43_09020, partial [Oscillospiraceae bacterium]|nr:hypothetical protein [Oscillospiraceae bacterium]
SETGDYKTPVKVVSSLYRGNDTLKTLDGKNEVHDFPDKYSLWEFVLMAYNFPQILAQINYKSSLPEGQKYHDRFYDANNNERPWRTIKIANMDHEDINTNPRFIKMWFLAPTLYQIILGVVGLLMCWKKRGIMTQFFPLLFGAIGIVGYFTNRILLYNNYPATYWVHIVMCILVLANAIIGFVIQALEIKSRPDEYYLPMV